MKLKKCILYQSIYLSMQNTFDWKTKHCKTTGFLNQRRDQISCLAVGLFPTRNIETNWDKMSRKIGVMHGHYALSTTWYSLSKRKISGLKNQKNHTKKRCKCNVLHSLKVTRYLVGDIMMDKWQKRRPVFLLNNNTSCQTK